MSGVTVKIEGLDKVQGALEAIRRLPPREIHRIAAGAVLAGTKLRFRQGQDPKGDTWASKRTDEASRLQSSKRRLVRSLTSSYNDQYGKVGTNVIYAAIHQFGGTIRPRKKKALAIPLTKEAAAIGSPRFFPRKLKLIWEKGAKQGFLYEFQLGKKPVAQYVLVHQVTIPARPFLGVSDGDRQEIGNRLVAKITAQAKQGMK